MIGRIQSDDFDCKSLYDKFTASLALAVVAAFSGLAAFFSLIIKMFTRKVHKTIPFALSLFMAALLIISFAISVSIFTTRQCGNPSFKTRGYSVNWGLGIPIASSIVAIIATILFHLKKSPKKTGFITPPLSMSFTENSVQTQVHLDHLREHSQFRRLPPRQNTSVFFFAQFYLPILFACSLLLTKSSRFLATFSALLQTNKEVNLNKGNKSKQIN